MLAIARFNWPFYVAAASVFIGAGAACMIVSGLVPRLALAAVLAGAAYFIFGSLGVSHLIYDRSDLYRWHWLERVLPAPAPERAVFCHCGFDETSTALRARFPSTEWLILDHYDPTVMTEPSIRRARRSGCSLFGSALTYSSRAGRAGCPRSSGSSVSSPTPAKRAAIREPSPTRACSSLCTALRKISRASCSVL